MLNITKVEEKNQQEALKNALLKLNSNESEVFYYYDEKTSGLFKNKKTEIYIITKYELKKFISSYISSLANNMNIIIQNEIIIKDNVVNVTLISDKTAALIGKQGQTLNSIQNLLRQTIKKYGNFNIKINLDVSGYKKKREKSIAYIAKQTAKEVSETKIAAQLDPMNSYERRIVHTQLADFPNIITESEGEGIDRRVVIKYEDAK